MIIHIMYNTSLYLTEGDTKAVKNRPKTGHLPGTINALKALNISKYKHKKVTFK